MKQKKFLRSIQAIYQEQSAQIIINGNLTDSFKIKKGTRHRCPLSPSLFILPLEILLIKLRNSKNLTGIKIKQEDFRLKAFSDDLVITTHEGVTEFLDILTSYGKVSSFKINKIKSKILVKKLAKDKQLFLSEFTGFEIAEKVKYLGVYISPSNSKLYKNNYEKLWIEVKREMEGWKKLQQSLLGKVATIQVSILPKFLFLFQIIPIF